jgi:hypothetical protein
MASEARAYGALIASLRIAVRIVAGCARECFAALYETFGTPNRPDLIGYQQVVGRRI